MDILLLVVSIFMNVISCGLLRNAFCKKDVKSEADLYLFNAVCSVVSMLVLLVIAAAMGSLCIPSVYTVGMGILYGIATALCALFNMKALESGPLSYTNIIISCAMVIPSLSGMALYGESITLFQWVGIALMLVSIFCAVDQNNGESGASLRWLLLCLVSFVCNGSVGVLQKIHQNSIHQSELAPFLVIAFLVATLFSFALALHARKRNSIRVLSNLPRFAVFVLISGLGIALCNQINMYLSGVMPSIIFFPVVNGAGMLLTTTAGLVLWKERLSRRQLIGMAAGALAIILLCGVL